MTLGLYRASYDHVVAFAKSHRLDVSKPSFLGEIGKFLTRKLVHCAPSLDACKQLVFTYEDQDVYKLALALSEDVAEKIAKLRSPNWELIVYDFRKKYDLRTSPKTLRK